MQNQIVKQYRMEAQINRLQEMYRKAIAVKMNASYWLRQFISWFGGVKSIKSIAVRLRKSITDQLRKSVVMEL